jgi:hypothetical protein
MSIYGRYWCNYFVMNSLKIVGFFTAPPRQSHFVPDEEPTPVGL